MKIYHSVDKTGDDSEDEIEEGDPLVLLLSLDSLNNWNPGMELKAKLSTFSCVVNCLPFCCRQSRGSSQRRSRCKW